MTETIEKLKIICQKKERKDWGYLVHNFYRPISWYFVLYLLKTRISANQVTLISIMFGLLGSYCFTINDPWFSLYGAILLFLWFIFECCDGSVARYRNVKEGKSLTKFGRYLDWFNLKLTTNILFLCITLNEYWQSRSTIVLLIGLYIIFIWFIINTLPNLIRFFKHGLGSFNVRPSINVNSSILEKIYYYNYVFIKVNTIPIWFFLGSIIGIIFNYLGFDILLGNIEYSINYIIYLLLGFMYTAYFITEKIVEFNNGNNLL